LGSHYCRELVKKPDRPWADRKRGKAIARKALAALLKPFNIIPDKLYLHMNPDARGLPAYRPVLQAERAL